MVERPESTERANAFKAMSQTQASWNRQRLETAVKALRKHGFNAFWVETGAEARDRALEMIPVNAHVGLGGSMSMRQLGLVDALRARGNKVSDHWQPGLSREQEMAIRHDHLSCDVYLASSNAVTMEGELINIDGAGNRVAALAFGPPRVVIIAGVNKLVVNIMDGLSRAKNVAAALRARSLSREVPCAYTGQCNDCDSPGRICRITTITERCPSHTPDYTVILVNEPLGF